MRNEEQRSKEAEEKRSKRAESRKQEAVIRLYPAFF